MNPHELRTLADALSSGTHYVESPELHEAMMRAADYLRACADAPPVAWVDVADSYEGPYIFRGKELLPAGRHDLYTHPAPAAPHHAMLDSHRRLVEQAIHTAEHPSGMSTHDGKARIDASILRRMLAIIDSLPAAPQAEPLSDVRIAEIQRAAYERAAKECENRSGPIEIYNRAYPHYLECAAAIRALGRQHD